MSKCHNFLRFSFISKEPFSLLTTKTCSMLTPVHISRYWIYGNCFHRNFYEMPLPSLVLAVTIVIIKTVIFFRKNICIYTLKSDMVYRLFQTKSHYKFSINQMQSSCLGWIIKSTTSIYHYEIRCISAEVTKQPFRDNLFTDNSPKQCYWMRSWQKWQFLRYLCHWIFITLKFRRHCGKKQSQLHRKHLLRMSSKFCCISSSSAFNKWIWNVSSGFSRYKMLCGTTAQIKLLHGPTRKEQKWRWCREKKAKNMALR